MAKYSYEFKLDVVEVYLKGNGGYGCLANKYNISSKTSNRNNIRLPIQKNLSFG